LPLIASTIVEVCVFRFTDNGPEYLLLKRSAGEKEYPGLWQLVSGSIEGKERAFEAALRELQEETGFTPEHFWVVPHVSTFYDPSNDSMNMTSVFAAQVPPGAEPRLSDEHESFFWLRKNEGTKKLVWPGQRQALEVVDEYIVGGAEASRFTEIPIKR